MANVLHAARTIILPTGEIQIPFTCEEGLHSLDGIGHSGLYNWIAKAIHPDLMRTRFVERGGDWIALYPTLEVTTTSDTMGFVTIKVHEFREDRAYLAQQGIFTLDDLRRRDERLALID